MRSGRPSRVLVNTDKQRSGRSVKTRSVSGCAQRFRATQSPEQLVLAQIKMHCSTGGCTVERLEETYKDNSRISFSPDMQNKSYIYINYNDTTIGWIQYNKVYAKKPEDALPKLPKGDS